MKIGMIFEGGACRSAFSAGVMDAFMDHDLYGDYLIGVSAGACYMMSYASRQRGRNKELVVRYIPDRRYMGPKYLSQRRNRSYFNLEFIYDQIPNYYLPMITRHCRRSRAKWWRWSRICNRKAEYLPVPRKDKRSVLLRATCALPLMFPPIEYCGNLYMDGGIADPIPVTHTLEDAGCDKAIVILTQTAAISRRRSRRWRSANCAIGTIRLSSRRWMSAPCATNGALARVRKYEEEGRAFVIAPKDSSGYHRLEQDPKVLEQWYNDGYQEAMERMDALRSFLKEEQDGTSAASLENG